MTGRDEFVRTTPEFCGSSAAGTLSAKLDFMLAILLTTLGVGAVALIAEWLACAAAPLGYQDETGFHFGREPEAHDEWHGNPS